MKKFTFLTFAAILLFSVKNSFAQQIIQPNPTQQSERCGTNKWLEDMFRTYPGFKEQYEENERNLANAINLRLQQIQNNPGNRTTTISTIPIVFHVVLSNQSLVPDAMILAQLNRINQDYSGLNPDSANGSPFFSVRGHSPIQFCLAQRTPANLPTNGIDRVVSSTTSTVSSNDPIKSTAAGGADAWDPTKYVNIWVSNFSDPGLLGYGTFPTGSPQNPGGASSQQGVVIEKGTLPGGAFAPYNAGRTLTHELGHFLWLIHIWGDDVADPFTCSGSGGCTGSDFPGTPALDDTPNQCSGTGGCPSGSRFDVCTPGGAGYMYQNYMDYTNDACMTMLTIGQDLRAQTALSTYRPGLLTSNGCVPPTLLLNDASIAAIPTPSAGFITCDPTTPLTVTLRNVGSNTLTSVRITVTRNGTPIQTFDWTGSLASIATVAVPLNPVPLVLGANSIQVCTSLPNGVADADASNDCFTVSGTQGAGTALPLVEGFESATFPPAGWIRNNPDNNITWQRTTTGIAHGGVGKAFVDHYNYSLGPDNDDLRTPPYAIGTADSLWVSYWAAYRGYPGLPFEFFQVMVSTNCGQSFQVVYTARNDTAFVAPDGASATTTSAYFPTNVNEWKRKSLDLSAYIPSGNIMVQFRAINQFGNNMHLDDINIDKKVFFNNDAGVIAVNKPAGRICSSSDAPVVVIKNYGKINLTSVKINFQIDGTGPITTFNWTGNLTRNQTATVTLATANLGAIGNHSINVYTTLPNNVTDQDPGNDALVKPYNVNQVFTLPGSVTEEFTSGTFPPTNWFIINPNADITWQRNGSIGNRTAGSAYFNDFANTSVDRYDDLAMPNYSYSGIDSVFLSFNLAHITKTLPGTTGSRLDTLSVLLSKDCGNTFTTVYQKYGEELQTVNDPNFQISMSNFIPLASQWRRDSVNLGKWLGGTEPLFQLMFRFSGNMENNFYLDDVNVRSQILPAKLKNEGYLVLPNPFRSTFGVWHYQVPTTLRYINVYNSVGQLVYSKQFPNGGDKYFQIDLGGRAAGTYTVNIGYDDSNRNVNVQVVKF